MSVWSRGIALLERKFCFVWRQEKTILWAKHYIWTNKVKNTHLSILSFRFVLFKRIEEVKELCEINEEYKNEFHEWVPIYNYLYAGE